MKLVLIILIISSLGSKTPLWSGQWSWPRRRLELRRHKPALVSAFDFGSGLALAFLVIVQRLPGICTKASRQLEYPAPITSQPIPHPRRLGLMPIVCTVASANHHQHYAEGSRAKIWPQVIKLPAWPQLPFRPPDAPSSAPGHPFI